MQIYYWTSNAEWSEDFTRHHYIIAESDEQAAYLLKKDFVLGFANAYWDYRQMLISRSVPEDEMWKLLHKDYTRFNWRRSYKTLVFIGSYDIVTGTSWAVDAEYDSSDESTPGVWGN